MTYQSIDLIGKEGSIICKVATFGLGINNFSSE